MPADRRIHVMLLPADIVRLDTVARRRGMSRSQLVREYVQRGLQTDLFDPYLEAKRVFDAVIAKGEGGKAAFGAALNVLINVASEKDDVAGSSRANVAGSSTEKD